MNNLIGIVFMLALGALFAAQGWTALLWLPLGLGISLFAVSNILLLPLMGIPMAVRLGQIGIARPGLTGAILGLLAVQCLIVLVILAVLYWVFPILLLAAMHNPSFLVGAAIGAAGVLLSAFSASGKKDFELDFFKRFAKYMNLPPDIDHPRNST